MADSKFQNGAAEGEFLGQQAPTTPTGSQFTRLSHSNAWRPRQHLSGGFMSQNQIFLSQHPNLSATRIQIPPGLNRIGKPNHAYLPAFTSQPSLAHKIQSLIKVRRDLQWTNALAEHRQNPFSKESTVERFKRKYQEYRRLRSAVLDDVEKLLEYHGAMMPKTNTRVPDQVAKDWVKQNFGVIPDEKTGAGARTRELIVNDQAKADAQGKKIVTKEKLKAKKKERKLKEGDVLEESWRYNPIQPTESAVVNRDFTLREKITKEVQWKHTKFSREEWARWKAWDWRVADRPASTTESETPLSPKSTKRKAEKAAAERFLKGRKDEFGQRIDVNLA